jgi:hypothetical protein
MPNKRSMKVKELKEMLNKFDEHFDDFDVEISYTIPSDTWPDMRTMKLDCLGDIGYSSKVIIIDGYREEDV